MNFEPLHLEKWVELVAGSDHHYCCCRNEDDLSEREREREHHKYTIHPEEFTAYHGTKELSNLPPL